MTTIKIKERIPLQRKEYETADEFIETYLPPTWMARGGLYQKKLKKIEKILDMYIMHVVYLQSNKQTNKQINK